MDKIDLQPFVKTIHDGGIVAFPTETVYGLGADAFNASAVKKIFEAKGRPADNPLIVHIASLEDISQIASHISDFEMKIFQKFSPGPITVLVQKRAEIPDIVTAGSPLVGIRIPDHEVARAFLKEAGVPIAAPSANISGKPSATHHDHVIDAFGERVPVIKAGASQYGMESTVVKVTEEQKILILRQGAISQEDLQQAFPETIVMIAGSSDTNLKASPGTRYKHYAPEGDITLIPYGTVEEVVSWVQKNITQSSLKSVIVCSDEVAKLLFSDFRIIRLGSEKKLLTIASSLYGALLECDKEGIERILIQSFPEEGIGRTVMERIMRASKK